MLSSRLPLLAMGSMAVVALAACGSSVSGSAGSCGVGPSGVMGAGRTVFVGVMLPGPSVSMGGRSVLVSPARVRVVRYLKGRGPAVVTVETAVSRVSSGIVGNSEGIEPQAGERWKIYTSSLHMPYQTSVCTGSAPAGGRQ